MSLVTASTTTKTSGQPTAAMDILSRLYRAAYVAIGTDLEGRKIVLRVWLSANESAKYWLAVLNGLKNREVFNILIASVGD